MQTLRKLALSATLLALSSSVATADDWYVDVNGVPPGLGTKAFPFLSIGQALNFFQLEAGDKIRVAPGTYFESVDVDGKDVELIGTGGAAVTIIDGSGTLGSAVVLDGSSSLRGFTVRGGSGNLSTVRKGGGVMIRDDAVVKDCVIRSNSADWGAGVYVPAGSPRIEGTSIELNGDFAAGSLGGGVYVGVASPTFLNCQLEGNRAQTGGGVYIEDSTATLAFCDFIGNESVLGGGAIFGFSGALTVNDSFFSDNYASDEDGGAVLVDGASIYMGRCVLGDNSVDNDHRGGAVAVHDGSLTLEDSTLRDNFAANGGAIYSEAFLIVMDSELSGNTARPSAVLSGTGGALLHGGGFTLVQRTLFHSNQAQSATGANGLGGAVFGQANLENCTIADNTGGGVWNAILDSSIHWGNVPGSTGGSSIEWSTVEGGAAGISNLALDPLFAGNYRLSAGSPCIDAGNPMLLDPDGSRVDMGAFPFASCSAPESYCTAGVSAAGCQATLAASGTASASAASGFVVSASGVEGQKDGLYFYGSNGRQQTSWGNGSSLQCVLPPVRRGPLMIGSGAVGACDGGFALDLNARWTAVPAHNPGAGALVQLQLWYRDPQSTSNQTTSLSDALEFGVCP